MSGKPRNGRKPVLGLNRKGTGKMTAYTININGIKHREVTGGSNGYPTPVLGVALFADSVEELKELGRRFGLDQDNVYGDIEIPVTKHIGIVFVKRGNLVSYVTNID